MQLTMYPSALLINETRPISAEMFGTSELRHLVEEMFKLLQEAKGVGLAGNQAGVTKNIFVTMVDGVREVFINSEIADKSEEKVKNVEMCLSLPGVQVEKERSKSITLRWKTIEGEEKTEKFEGFKAVVLQHEFGHISGKTIVCDLSKLKRDMLLKKGNKFVKQQKALYDLKEKMKNIQFKEE